MRMPRILRSTLAPIDPAGEDEEEIREPIQVDLDESCAFLNLSWLDDGSLGAPSDRTADVERRAAGRATGDDEAGDRLALGIETIDALLEVSDLPFADADGAGA